MGGMISATHTPEKSDVNLGRCEAFWPTGRVPVSQQVAFRCTCAHVVMAGVRKKNLHLDKKHFREVCDILSRLFP